MGSLTSCIADAGNLLSDDQKRAILLEAQRLRRQGVRPSEAAVRAVEAQMTKTRQLLADAEKEYRNELSVSANEERGGARGSEGNRKGQGVGQEATRDAVQRAPEPAQATDPQVARDLAAIDAYRRKKGEQSELEVVPANNMHAGLAQAIANAFRAPIFVIQNKLGMTGFNGVEIDGRVYIAADADSPSISIAIHETFHTMPEDIKKRTVDAIMETVSPLQMDSFLDEFPAYGSLSESRRREELAARIIEDDSQNPGFWLALHRKLGATEFGKLVRHILSTLDRIIAGFAKTDSSKFTTDIKRVREVVAVAFAEAQERMNGKEDPDGPAALERDRQQAAEYAAKHGILPYVPGPRPGIPLDGAEIVRKPLFSVKQIKTTGKNAMDIDPGTGLPLNKSVKGAPRTVTLYYPTTKEKARQIVASKTLPAVEGSNRVYVTNESQAFNLLGPGGVGQATDGTAIKILIDPALLQVHNEFPNGRKDFFIPTDTGGYSQRKNIQLWSLLAPNTEAIDPTATNVRLREDVAAAVAEWQAMNTKQRRTALAEAKAILKREHNVGTLLGENGKLQKTRAGGYGLTYDDKSVASMGLGMASAQKINDGAFNTCPNRAICEGSCLGDSSGQNLLYGGAADLAVGLQRGTDFRAGPRLSQFLKTQAFIVNTRAFTIKLQSEIEAFKRWAAKTTGTEKIENDDGTKIDVPKQMYAPSFRLNVTSDIDPKVWEPLIELGKPDVFYDYTKLDGDPVADNHHLTYSSTGGSQTVMGVPVYNKYSNWKQRIKRLRKGYNVAMAFSDANSMPAYIVDEASGEKFQVWNGDNYDARFLDPKPGQPGNEFGKGMVIGLTNKDRTKAKVSKFIAKAGLQRATPAQWGAQLDQYEQTLDGQEDRSVPIIREWLRKQQGELTIGEFNAFAGHPSVRSVGFFVDYDPARDGDTVTMRDQDAYGDGPGGRKVLPIKAGPNFSERAARAVTETPEFKRWFGDSKVVDAQGKPLVVYHGTDADIEAFSPKLARDGSFGKGFYFTTSADAASKYAGERRGANVTPVYLALNNPATLKQFNEASGDIKKLKRQGFDGLQLEMKFSGDKTIYVAFKPEQIKSATGNRGTFDPENPDIRFSERAAKPTDVSPIGFYSELARRAEQGPGSGTAQAWKDFFRGQTTKGVKADEIEWSGINEWLDLQQGKVTKAQVGEYLKNNGVQVQETVLEGEPDLDKWIPEDSDEQYGPSPANPAKFVRYTLPGGTNYREVLLTLPVPTKTETVAVGKGPFEARQSDGKWFIVDRLGEWGVVGYATRAEAEAAFPATTTKDVQTPTKEIYQSGHWEQPNVLAHIRLNDRTDADGKKVLFVEEIQSDWGQAGKKKGFTKPEPADYNVEVKLVGSWHPQFPDQKDKWRVTVNGQDRGYIQAADESEARYKANANETNRRDNSGTVPDAPFVTATDKWVALAMKRIVKMAVDGGYDKVAFVNGEQSADRYDLSKQINMASAFANGDGTYNLVVEDKNGNEVGDMARSGKKMTPQELEDTIGKDLAKKLIDGAEASKNKPWPKGAKVNPAFFTLRGLDLKVGGEGMKAFYDKIVPSVAKDVMKKVGGGSLQTVKFTGKTPRDFIVIPGIGSDITIYDNETNQWVGQLEPFRMVNDVRQAAVFSSTSMAQRMLQSVASKMPGLEQPGFDITPAMREKAAGGLPMFSERRPAASKASTDTPEFKRWFGDSKVVDADGKPRVVYHGTTNDFTTFDNAAASIESDLGAGFYFSNEPEDVANNYAGEGPDLTQKIEMLAERIFQDDDVEVDEMTMDVARQMARERLSQSKPNTMPVYLSIKNPVVLGGDNETFFDYNEEYNEELDEYGEPTGALVDVVEALRNVPGSFVDFDPEKVIADIFEKSMGDGLNATDLFKTMKQSEGMAYAIDDDSGALAATEIIRQAFAEAGYDGYIDNTVDAKFGSSSVGARKYGKGMKGMNPDTVHYVAFRPQQIKSAIGNRGTFDNMNADIRFSERKPKTYTPLLKRIANDTGVTP